MTARDEVRKILDLNGGNAAATLNVLEHQLNVLHGRADRLMSLAGIVITVTGFSGRLIAATNRPAQALIVAGLGATVASVVWTFAKSGRIRWLTSQLEGDTESALASIIERRDARTQAYRIGGSILCIGLTLYALSIAIMLLNPGPVSLPVR